MVLAAGIACKAESDWRVCRTEIPETCVTVKPAADWKSGAPRINGPAVYGATPGHAFSYAFPVCGSRTGLEYALDGNLPDGVRFDARRGAISGRAQAGEWRLRFTARNVHGADAKDFLLKIGAGCRALTPPMGWTSWNAFGHMVSADRIRREARALVDTGLAARGWTFVNCDAGWAQDVGKPGVRRPKGPILPNPAFADMAGLICDIHALGLKAGVYSSPMIYTWASGAAHAFVGTGDYPVDRSRKLPYVPFNAETNGIGTVRHVAEDAAQWAAWGVDWLKYDWCGTEAALGAEMRAALDVTGRDIVLQLCTDCRPAESNAFSRTAELVRGSPDVKDSWTGRNGLSEVVRAIDPWVGYIGPGRWYDLDMLAVGRLSIDRKTDGIAQIPDAPLPSDPRFDNKLTRDEQVFHFAYWAFAPAPLFLSCELEGLTGLVLDLAANEELIAINQDALGKPAAFEEKDGVRFGSRPLADGSRAVAAFNFNEMPCRVSVPLAAGETARDVLAGRDVAAQGMLTFGVPAHGARVFAVRKEIR